MSKTINWSELEHAYGTAEDVPQMLEDLINNNEKSFYWESIWSSLCHQETIYSATFVFIPQLVQVLKDFIKNKRIDNNIFYFITCVELSRQTYSVEYPNTLEYYLAALEEIDYLAYEYLKLTNSFDIVQSILAYQAVRKNLPSLTQLLLELSPENTDKLLNLLYQ